MTTSRTIERIMNGFTPTAGELEALLEAEGDALEELYDAANRVRAVCCGTEVHIQGVIVFSNYCRNRCPYCGMNGANRKLARYRLDPDEVVELARRAMACGYRSLVLQSGEDPWYDKEKISSIVQRIRGLGDAGITLSLGERSYDEYSAWIQAGADRYMLRHETSNQRLFRRLRPGSRLDRRFQALQALKDLGYEVGSGFMVGLPGQTIRSLAADLLMLKFLRVDVADIRPFVPYEGLPLSGVQRGSAELTRKAVAIARLLLKRAHLPASVTLDAMASDANRAVFSSGANVVVQAVAPAALHAGLSAEAEPEEEDLADSMEATRRGTEEWIRLLGRDIAVDRGDSLMKEGMLGG